MSSPKFARAKPGELTDMITACYKHQSDTFEPKIDMIPGVYKTDEGKPYVLPFVKEIETRIINSPDYNHDYILFLGNEKLNSLAPRLILGEDNPVIKDGRAFAVQSIGGCGALRMGAELLTQHANFTTVYFSEPTWDNHETTFLNGGFKESKKYRYFDPVTNGVDFNGMMEDLAQAPEYSVIVLQACAHNPTGCDLTRDQWHQVATVLKVRIKKGIERLLLESSDEEDYADFFDSDDETEIIETADQSSEAEQSRDSGNEAEEIPTDDCHFYIG